MDTAQPGGGGAGRRHCAHIGSPPAPLLAPLLHTTGHALLGLDWRCTAIECAQEELPALLGALDASWAGLSLTAPLERTALEVADTVTAVAHDTGAADTLVLHGRTVTAHNTAVLAFAAALGEVLSCGADSALVLGEGAAACSALMALHMMGLPAAQVAARSGAGAFRLHEAAERIGIHIRVHTLGSVQPPRTDVVVSTLPGASAAPFARGLARPGTAAVDLSYAAAPTPLVRAVTRAGGRAADGLVVLAHRVAAQVRLMTGTDTALEDAMLTAGRAALRPAHRAGGPAGAATAE